MIQWRACVCVCVCVSECEAQSHRSLCDPWTVAHQTPLRHSPGKNAGAGCRTLLRGIFPTWGSSPPGDLPHPGIRPAALKSSVLAGGFFTTEPPGKGWTLDNLTRLRVSLLTQIPPKKSFGGSFVFKCKFHVGENRTCVSFSDSHHEAQAGPFHLGARGRISPYLMAA